MRLSGCFLLLTLSGLLVLSAVKCQDDIDEDFEDDVAIAEDDSIEEAAEETQEKPRMTYTQPRVNGNSFFVETFDSQEEYSRRWILSEAKKEDTDEVIAKYDGKWSLEEPEDNPLLGDKGLVLKTKAKHAAIAAPLDSQYVFSGKPFVMQYEVKFQNGQECGGAYVKLLTKETKTSLKKFVDKSPYTIMFGPDKCGNDAKLHFIFRHKNPVNGKFEEKHAKKPKAALDAFFTDKKIHLYTLVINPDNTFEIYVDQNLVNSGSLLEDVTPPVNPEKEIVDPEDKKPENWDEREKIPDPEAVKPEDWNEDAPEFISDPSASKPAGWLDDEPELIPDPDSEIPSDWDPDMDGDWEPPMISNPACEEAPGCGEWSAPNIKNPEYKGKWKAALIDNPDYQGKWKPRKIANPDYFEDLEPYKMSAISAVGLELWSMSDGIYFDNFIITDDKKVADEFAAEGWELKHAQELAGSSAGRSVVDAVMEATHERPWLWAVILIVIILPIVLVVAYCCMSGGSSKGVFQYLWDAAEERKWLYGVYVVVFLLPIALLSVWLCPNAGPIKPEDIARADAARRKKTDAASPDAKEEDDEEEEEEEEEEGEGQEEGAKGADKEQQTEAGGDSTAAAAAASAAAKKASKASKKSDLEAEENEGDNEEDADTSAARSSPRKRKTRARKD